MRPFEIENYFGVKIYKQYKKGSIKEPVEDYAGSMLEACFEGDLQRFNILNERLQTFFKGTALEEDVLWLSSLVFNGSKDALLEECFNEIEKNHKQIRTKKSRTTGHFTHTIK